ncbi:branched-chain amino acid aminotransferase [Nisaea acidiphila]|uniref:Probable branched-chain-amino-acid aminotransferase n=1 Tax=Nisaea acidiphila TaxID=1862145 RepID=A0A9J7AS46_9PROT|nr:branched-chain amino acid aminotransferase [Nisaea acidiphila]UUX50038.1 branched-chain amino acid aminotransferase [Nisaea acidiphila]
MKQIFFYRGEWLSNEPMVSGPLQISFWSGSSVFDGARAIKGALPDIGLHAQRVVRSAKAMLLNPGLEAKEIESLCRDAAARLPADRDYYIRPMFYSTGQGVAPEGNDTEFVLAVFEAPLPDPIAGGACLSSFRRCAVDQGPTNAKAGCLYPNGQRALLEARDRGFDLPVLLDPNGNVAEFSTANIWIVKDGVAKTPAANGTFLSGITRRRLIRLLTQDGIPVEEAVLSPEDLATAEEIIVCGNFGKIQAIDRFEDRMLTPGPVFERARALYMQFVESERQVPAAAE